MRKIIAQLGHIKSLLIITLFSTIASILIYIPVAYLIDDTILFSGILIAVIAPMIIAPSVSWYMIRLIIQIDLLETQMRELATFDNLTKVMSREAFLTNAQTIYKLIQRDKSLLAVLYIDIDDFKKVNDTYGHSIGDKVLKDFGHILRENTRKSDLVGRLGGEEFAFILADINSNGAIKFANNLRDRVNNTVVKLDDISISYSISIGISIFSNKKQVNLEELINQSDKALYIAKNSGKNCTILYEGNKSQEEELHTC